MSIVSDIREQIRHHTRKDENDCVNALLEANAVDESTRSQIVELGCQLVEKSRASPQKVGSLDAFIHEFGLSNSEGIALMCLAESLIRVPDATTADKLIAEKVSLGNWQAHIGNSDSLFVNASTWGLLLTGKITRMQDLHSNPTSWFERMVNRLGEPLVRQAMRQAMRLMGRQYVLGGTINEAIKRGYKENSPGTRFSFDMLGEGARTQEDAEKYFQSYAQAIEVIGRANSSKTAQQVTTADGISVKLSALHPRYEWRQHERVRIELLPRLLHLAHIAREFNISLSIDAEEADRLDLTLDLFESLAQEPSLHGWDGLGFVLQAYQKRAPLIAHWLIALAQQSGRKFMVRLVKGAYWDNEIKLAQVRGLMDYPVFTRKVNTDLCYQICSQILLSAQSFIFPQFASHNAYTVAMIDHLAAGKDFEYQRLHGMGNVLYHQLQQLNHGNPRAIRVYAPVGSHEHLLPYLVRRLLENGANSSFVNRFLDAKMPVEKLIFDVVDKVKHQTPYRHSNIPVPSKIFENSQYIRSNSEGFDLADPIASSALLQRVFELGQTKNQGGSIINGVQLTAGRAVECPANGNIVGFTVDAIATDVDAAIASAVDAQAAWDKLGGLRRAAIIEAIGEIFQQQRDELLSLLCFEAGRTVSDGIDEIREAIDFCRYYALLARRYFAEPESLPGPTGERNELSLHGRGVFVCISPWNFPLAIFTGQVVAALVAGNTVVAKPAEQTPLIAAKATQLMQQAGVPPEVLHLIVGNGEVGARLVNNINIAGVAFTGSTTVAKRIQLTLAQQAGPIIPLIAETGGVNAMIVDSSALAEQVVDDVIASAFHSAGQRCSALRVLFLQTDIATDIINMLTGACAQLVLGKPWELKSDIGPIIDKLSHNKLLAHIHYMQENAELLYAYPQEQTPVEGLFLGPHIFELQSLQQLKTEVFGPILHIIRFEAAKLQEVMADINRAKYGLTMGIHSRLEQQAEKLCVQAKVGNVYINRNMVGAVVGVNPFGGQGMSGTGPKAGGPYYLFRFATEKTKTINTVATGGNPQLLQMD